MSGFTKFSPGGIIGFADDGHLDTREMAILNNILSPHRFQLSGDIYGINDINAMLQNASVDTSQWPKFTKSPIIQSASPSTEADYYRHLMTDMLNQYMQNAIDKGHILSQEFITKKLPVFDISKIYRTEGLSKFAFPEVTYYEDEIDHMRHYGWEMFVPCMNKLTIRINTQRYIVIELQGIDASVKTFMVLVSEYVGNRFQWARQSEVQLGLSFYDGACRSGLGLPMDWSFGSSQGYETYLSDYIPDMNWSPAQIALWRSVFGITEMTDPYLLTILPSKRIRDMPDLEPMARNGVTTIMFGKQNIQTLSRMKSVETKIILQGEDADKFYRRQVALTAFIVYAKAITAVNLHLLYHQPDAMAVYTAEVSHDIGSMKVTLPQPAKIRIPSITPILTKEDSK